MIGFRAYAGDATLGPGAKGAAVSELQRLLTQAGADTQGVDGTYGPNTYQAVRNFQAAYALKVDGIAGAETWAKLRSVTTGTDSTSNGTAPVMVMPEETIIGHVPSQMPTAAKVAIGLGVVAIVGVVFSSMKGGR